MLVLKESRDPEVIRPLVERGASFTAVNKKDKTVEDMAIKINSAAINLALYASKSRLDVAEVIQGIVGLIGIIIAWLNNQTLNKVVWGVTREMNKVIRKVHNISG